MKPAAFSYHRPASVEEALSLLAQYGGDAQPLAGGQSLVPARNVRLARPGALIDLNGMGALAYIKEEGDRLVLGAMTRQRALERSAIVGARAPLVAQAMPWIAHPQIRNRGTVGGSLAHADPAAELPAVMVALDAEFVVRSPAATRRLAASQFYTGLFSTALAEDELLVAIEIAQRPSRSGAAFLEVSRRHGDFALAGVAAEVALDAAGRCAHARIALLSVGDGPVLATAASRALLGAQPDDQLIAEASRLAAHSDIDPPGDIHASPDYRRQLVQVLVRRTLATAISRAKEGTT